jgi:hypothetical protein
VRFAGEPLRLVATARRERPLCIDAGRECVGVVHEDERHGVDRVA